MRFPPGHPRNDELDEIKADLVLRDAEVAEIVLELERAGHDRDIVWPVIDLLAEIDGIIARLTTCVPNDDSEARLRQWQLEYAKALRAVYADALSRRAH
jgi:hypothetical protein